MVVTHFRRFFALLFLAGGVALALPLGGCGLFLPPALPGIPQIPEIPQPPPPPDPKPPELPKLQSPIPFDNTGNCCFRNTQAVDRCSGATRCCSDKFEVDDCESKGGFWFHTSEDCAGAC